MKITIKSRIKALMQPRVLLTADEIAGALGMSVLSVRPRTCELHKAGFLVIAGHSKNKHGNLMAIWERAFGRT